MNGRVIQGFFVGDSRLPPTATAPLQRFAATAPRPASGAPAPAFSHAAGSPVQRRVAPGRPPLVHAAAAPVAPTARGHALQRFGGDGSFAVDPAQVGLVRSGGRPLPGALLAKMEAALGADFSGVRVHVGPQASRIGALAFTTGNDLYFAPGQYQPDSVEGQQLIGHELAHVIQQRQGRVRAPGGGVSVVQDRALEAEADWLGMKAAAHRASARNEPGAAVQRRVEPAVSIGRPHVAVGRQSPNTRRGRSSVATALDHAALEGPPAIIQRSFKVHIGVDVDEQTIRKSKITGIMVTGFYMPPAKHISGKKEKGVTQRAHRTASGAIRMIAALRSDLETVDDICKLLDKSNINYTGSASEGFLRRVEKAYSKFILDRTKSNPVTHDDALANQADGRQTRLAMNRFLKAHKRWLLDKDNPDKSEARRAAKEDLIIKSFSSPRASRSNSLAKEDRISHNNMLSGPHGVGTPQKIDENKIKRREEDDPTSFN